VTLWRPARPDGLSVYYFAADRDRVSRTSHHGFTTLAVMSAFAFTVAVVVTALFND
jgi:hypothetical protein